MNATLTQNRRQMKARLLHVNGRIMTLSSFLPFDSKYAVEIKKLEAERRNLMTNMPTMTACIAD